ncbi:MAG: hypothetical protein J7L71_03350 [Spirochaetaceae bacterium]|nr:hypothetical protein [Spirochaetaceae bacterium]
MNRKELQQNNLPEPVLDVERASSKLVKDGKLKFVRPKKGGYWEVLK